MNKKYLNMIGLAYRARKCSLGEETIIKDIKMQKAKLVVIASDTGPQTKKRLTDKCKFYNIPFVMVEDDRETISNALGKSQRVAVAILDAGFAGKIMTLIGE
ncbi:L7Ae/L30e/S12e/Gadd45 family ribosomal protein [Oceanobacillus bengalensis]|uniref:50S ribosomal protein L7ae n=1 Tax=Oceanobacillus bengalensis TaxID=1435466 RepID=A0A494Z467_9BACI|nr:ribosomal L7Ae/L30e/S12e/Gadd45 family protein [Oceanobacillus bengalensis]RKQ17334.1 50S ribosomal protein L7ae [Oceanobacillus bengalensis]